MKYLVTLLSVVNCLTSVSALTLPSAGMSHEGDSVYMVGMNEATQAATNFIKVLEADSLIVMDGDSIRMSAGDSLFMPRVSPEDSMFTAATESNTQYYLMKVNPASDKDAMYGCLLEGFMNYIKSMNSRTDEQILVIKDNIRKMRPEFEEAGIYYNQLGKNNKAYKFIECYLNIPRLPFYAGEEFMRNSNYATYVFFVASEAHNARELDDAVTFFQEYINLGEKANQERCYVFWAKDLERLERLDEMANVLDEGLMNYPRNIDMLKMSVNLYIKMHNIDKAQEMLDRALIVSPSEPGLLFFKATMDDENGRFADALPIYQSFYAGDSTDMDIKKRLALCYYNLAGVQINERNKSQDGGTIKELTQKATQNYNHAIPLLNQIVDAQPTGKKDRKLLYALEDAYKQIGNMDEAKRMKAMIDDGFVSSGGSSIPNFNEWYRPQLDAILAEWEARGEFEPAADYVKRVNPESRKMLIAQTRQACEARFINEYGGYFNLTDFTIKPYDPDHETFRIQTRQGDIYLKVPLANGEAEEFKKNWGKVKVANPQLRIDREGKMLLAMADMVTPSGKTYKYDVNVPLVYGKMKIAGVHWDDSDILLAGASEVGGKKAASGPRIEEPINVGESTVDVNIPVTKNENDNTFALIFANEDYKNVEGVPFAKNDGQSFRRYCMDVLGVDEKHIIYAENATRNEMIAAIGRVQDFKSAYKNMRLFVYYSGHGVPDPSTNESYLLPSDASPRYIAQTGYKLSSFYGELSANNPKSVTVFLDACFSGSKKDGEIMDKEARGVAIKPREEVPVNNMVVFSACTGAQTAYPYKNQKHGMFTYFLLKKLQEDKGKTSYKKLAEYIAENVKQKSLELNDKMQSPTVQTSLPKDVWEDWRLDKED